VAYTAPLLALSVLLSLLLPVSTAQASDGPGSGTEPTAESASGAEPTAEAGTGAGAEPAPTADGDCAPLPLAPFGDPGSAAVRTALPAAGSVCYTFTAERTGLHRVLLDGEGHDTYARVIDGGTPLDCHSEWGSSGWCDLPRTGAFTLKISNHGVDADEFTAAVTPLATTDGCEPQTGTSWGTAPVTGSAASPVGVLCHPFTAEPGERIVVDARTVRSGGVRNWITDGTGARICPYSPADGGKGCVLPGDGPYRVLLQVYDAEGGFPADYRLEVRRLSDPEGCASVPVNAYGSAPTAADPPTGCKVFTAPAAGTYEVYQVSSSHQRIPVAVYDRAGRTVCEGWESPCALPAAGDYTLLTEQSVVVLDRASSAGCEPVGLGVHQGTFDAAGETDCLTLPLPEGARMAALTPLSGLPPHPEVIVVDADGHQRCTGGDLGRGSCELTGAAPFRALVSTDDDDRPTGSYRIALHRTDEAGDCRAVPAGDFTADGASARFATGDGVFSHCLTIPADDHSRMENIQLRGVSSTPAARFSVVDAEGREVCATHPSTAPWNTCGLTPGVAHTVLVTAYDRPAEYTLARRDVTAGAEGCTAAPATAVGGPSTAGTPGAPGTLLCRRVTTGDAGDVLHLDVRDPLGTAHIVGYGADGGTVCDYGTTSCAVTGSTSYQVLVTVPVTKQAADSYRFDALRIATADGPAEECAEVSKISYGYGPITGTLDEQHTAVCAALPTKYADRFDAEISDTAGGAETAVPALYDPSLDNGCWLYPSTWKCAVSEPYTREVIPSILVLGLPEKASRTEYSARFACATAPCGVERVTVGSVTPAVGASGGKVTVTVTGTALHEDDKVRITRSGTTLESTATSVSADWTKLTAVLDLTGAAAGDWSLSVITHKGHEHAEGTFTVTPAPLENTAAPGITGTVRTGAEVTATPGAWSATPDSYAYQWKADGQAIEGATASTYRIHSSLLHRKLTVAVTARKSGLRSVTVESAALTVAAAPRDHAGPNARPDGVGDLLTVSTGGWLTFQQGDGFGGFSGKTSASGWSASVVAVPFGDLDGDRCNDVLVRMADGSLRGYRPACGKPLSPSTPYRALGTGWGAYNVLTSPGDLTGDGRADLLARQASTGDIHLFAAKGDGTLAAGKRIRSAWTTYTKVVGAGDLNGDGHGDVLAHRGDGALFRYDGTGTGLLKERVQLAAGWGLSYNALVGVGDITGDGHADIVVRDGNGVLYRNNGKGNGTFTGRYELSAGWGGYKGLF
jgi:hypothetical protein